MRDCDDVKKVFFPAASQLKIPRCFIGSVTENLHVTSIFATRGSTMQQFSTAQHMQDRWSDAKRRQIIRKVYGESVSTAHEGPTLSKYVCLCERNNP